MKPAQPRQPSTQAENPASGRVKAPPAGEPAIDIHTAGRMKRWNPIRGLTPQMLASSLDAWDRGELGQTMLLWDAMARRDDTIPGVKAKRERAVSMLDWQVLALSDEPEAADHAEVLRRFWQGARCEDAYDRNSRGGLRLLVRQLMRAVSYGYTAHHIVWRPSWRGLSATFEYVPGWFLENRSGRLRFLPDGFGSIGEEMDPSAWLVHADDPLMFPCSAAYWAKRLVLQDWITFSEAFSMPGIVGRTRAKRDSEAGAAMAAAVEAFGNDWRTVIYEDDTPDGKDPISLVQADGNPSSMPMPALVDRVDRKIAALYRGADLSTMSSGQGDVTGASVQGEETQILLRDDAETITERLREVERHVIEWTFGAGVPPLAGIQLIVPAAEDQGQLLAAVQWFHQVGVRLPRAGTLERFGLSEAADDEDALRDTPAPKARGAATNAAPRTDDAGQARLALVAELQELVGGAISADLAPLARALAEVPEADDMQAALRDILARMTDLAGEDAQARAWETVLATALADGFVQAGADHKDHTPEEEEDA